MSFFSVKLPSNPERVVEASSAYEAKDVYNQALGIISTSHAHVVNEVSDPTTVQIGLAPAYVAMLRSAGIETMSQIGEYAREHKGLKGIAGMTEADETIIRNKVASVKKK